MRATITLDTPDVGKVALPSGQYATPLGPIPPKVHVIDGVHLKARFDEPSKSWHITDNGLPRAIFSQFHVVSIDIVDED